MTKASLRFSYYEQGDHDGEGNPFLDEDLQVLEPVLIVEQELSEETRARVKVAHDYVTSASIARLDNYEQQSGASGDYYFGLDFGLVTKVGPGWELGGTIHGAFERDYRSAGGTASLRWESPSQNTALQASITGYYDTVIRIRFDGTNDGSAPRGTLSLDLTAYQVLTPWLHGDLTYTVSRQDGFLETALNAVVVDRSGRPNYNLTRAYPGQEFDESLPGLRVRHALAVRARAKVGPVAPELRLRGYADTWGLLSWECEPRLYAWLVPELLRARVRYRYYRQLEVRYYERRLQVLPYHSTQDPDLATLESHTLGGQVALYLGDWRFDTALDYVWRSDGLDQLQVSVGLNVVF